MSRRFVAAFAAVAVVLSFHIPSATALLEPLTPVADRKPSGVVIDGKLLERLEVGETDRFVVDFSARPDLSPARRIGDFEERGRFVMDALRATADTSQREALRIVRQAPGAKAASFWLRNALVVEGDRALAERLAALPGVKAVRAERVYPLVKPVGQGDVVRVAAGDPEWGVARIGADQVWDLGILGGGIVVANIDTGVEYTHPALSTQYRGNLGNGSFVHDYNWWDPSGICGPVPCDNVFHGTHVMGTMVGGDGPGPFTPDIGVAPGAQWIAAKGCEDFFCSEFALLSSGQWVLAPTDLAGQNPDPAKRPDIVNNSWGGGPGDPFYMEIVQAWRAAGIIPVFASGNPGPFCGAGGSPADYLESFSVGATDIGDVIAEFSGRGPSVFGKVNPDVAAPGVNVLSAMPGGGYEAFDGTSMAAPHTSGALALLLSAAHELIGDPATATDILAGTALDIIDLSCGGDADGDPNNVYGEGRVDALAAVQLAATGGTLAGTITDAETGSPISGARVSANNGQREFFSFTGADGTYQLFLAAGEYLVSAWAFGYETAIAPGVVIETDQTTVQDLALTSLPRFVLSGYVRSAEAGNPVAGAQVVALGTPVPPVTSDSQGAYALTLPLGIYQVEASAGGCREVDVADVELLGDLLQNFFLVTKIDDFGHGCRDIPNRWTTAKFQTALYGDDVYGRLRLPFDFPFYGQTYNQVFITSNGFLTFQDPFWASSFNEPIPSIWGPNAAVYPLWQDLVVDEESSVNYTLIGKRPNRALVVEFLQLRGHAGSGRVDFQVKLWENGDIDTLYRNNTDRLGNGSGATIGIENADGTDALQFSFMQARLAPNAAYRYLVVPTGVVGGVVTDANDGLPVAGARITASPGGRSATTAADGTYSLRLVPGRYVLTASASNYESQTSVLNIRARETPVRDFSLAAPLASVTPDAVGVTTDLDMPVTATVTVANVGSAPLIWDLFELDSGGVPPELPPLEFPAAAFHRSVSWAPPTLPAGFVARQAGPTFDGPLAPIIVDPAGDAVGPVDITTVGGGANDFEISMAIDFTAGTPMDQTVGLVFLDADRDPTTGLPPEAFLGKPTQDIGAEFLVDLFPAPAGFAVIWDAITFEFLGEVSVVVEGTTMRFDVPLDFLRGDDGSMDVALVMGDYAQPTDWAPDVGHGTIRPFRDAPWMSSEPVAGTVLPGESVDVTVTLGGPGVLPGTYAGALVFLTNEPRVSVHEVPVELIVELPDDFGALDGVVTNARTGLPVPALVTVHAQRGGDPYDATATAGESGGYLLFAPEGMWPVGVTLEGYLDFATEVTIVAGARTTLDVALEPLWPNALLEGGPLAFEVEPNGTTGAVLTLSNTGLADLDFEVFEAGGGQIEFAMRPIGAAVAADTRAAPAGWTATRPEVRVNGGDVLIFQDVLPWDSDALQVVLAMNGISFDLVGSDQMPNIDLAPYEVVFLSNDQPNSFYKAYAAHADRFEAYVAGGGFLWFGAAAWGWNDGNPDGVALPGGVIIDGPVYDEWNGLVQPDHPVLAGVPDPFWGDWASHGSFESVPDGSVLTIGSGSGRPTLIEYEVGTGRVMATGQTLEAAWAWGWDGGLILENAVPYAVGFEPFTDVPWLQIGTEAGTVVPGGSTELLVMVDATGLDTGTYAAEIVVKTNDPLQRSLRVPVTLVVAGP